MKLLNISGRIVLILALIVAVVAPLNALDLSNISVSAVKSSASGTDTSINNISGYGIRISANWKWKYGLSFSLSNSHLYYSIDQNDAIKNWNWQYWLKIYGNVVSLTKMDPIYEAIIHPKQTLKTKPITLTVQYEPSIWKKLHFGLRAGGGAVWYRRQLYNEETWQKYFSSIDYTYEYNFRNYANARSGWVFQTEFAFSAGYRFNQYIGLSLAVDYANYYKTRHDSDYFPLKRSVQANLELEILY